MNTNCRKRKEKQSPVELNEKSYIGGKEKSPQVRGPSVITLDLKYHLTPIKWAKQINK